MDQYPAFRVLFPYFLSCEKEELGEAMANRKTLFMFLPWSTDLTGYVYTNIADMEACVSRRGAGA